MPDHGWLLGAASHRNPYMAFTDRCNRDRPRIILSSDQACVWYRLSMASKDGDWLIREDDAVLEHVLHALAERGARYRPGAPLDRRWLSAGWSAHFESVDADGMRLRYDFVSRPPRLAAERLARLWSDVDGGAVAVVPVPDLANIKLTMRSKDMAFVGGLALLCRDPEDQLRWSQDPEHLARLLDQQPQLAARLHAIRPALPPLPWTRDQLETAIDRESRRARLMDERRMAAYATAMEPWLRSFRSFAGDGGDLLENHAQLCRAAADVLPTEVPCDG